MLRNASEHKWVQFLTARLHIRDYFDFDIVNFLFLDGDVPRRPSMVYIYLNLFALPEHLRMLMTSIIVTNS